MSIKALVVGVSEYHYNDNSNLPFCKNDIKAISKSLMKGLNVKKKIYLYWEAMGLLPDHLLLVNFLK